MRGPSFHRACGALFLLAMLLTMMRGTPARAIEVEGARQLVNLAEKGVLRPGFLCPLGSEGILVTDRAGRALLCFDHEGDLMWKTDGTGTGESGFLFPGAVACARGQVIYVLDTGLRKILQFDRRGSFMGYLVNDAVRDPSCLAQGEGGELYLYDATTWELICIEPDGSLRWRVHPFKLTGRVSSIRLSGGEIHLLVPEKAAIYSYGKFGEFLREAHLTLPGDREGAAPQAFWRDRDGCTYVCSGGGALVAFDVLMNPLFTLDSIEGRALVEPCDLSMSGGKMLLLDCGSRAVYEITLR